MELFGSVSFVNISLAPGRFVNVTTTLFEFLSSAFETTWPEIVKPGVTARLIDWPTFVLSKAVRTIGSKLIRSGRSPKSFGLL
jgi:hypothetical protein